jgi:pimeloyl-ACP methyl ester carboxylesterase
MVTGEMFEPVIEHLATRHRVIVPDLRGHGRSRGLPPPYTAGQLASDLSRLLDHLGIDYSTAVLGYSQGGAIAQQLVLDYPKRCDRLVLACTYAFNMATFRERLEGHLVPLLVNRTCDSSKPTWVRRAVTWRIGHRENSTPDASSETPASAPSPASPLPRCSSPDRCS